MYQKNTTSVRGRYFSSKNQQTILALAPEILLSGTNHKKSRGKHDWGLSDDFFGTSEGWLGVIHYAF